MGWLQSKYRLPGHSYPSEIRQHIVLCTSVLLAYSLIQFSKTKLKFSHLSRWREYVYIVSDKVCYGNIAVQIVILCVDRKFLSYIKFKRNPNNFHSFL